MWTIILHSITIRSFFMQQEIPVWIKINFSFLKIFQPENCKNASLICSQIKITSQNIIFLSTDVNTHVIDDIEIFVFWDTDVSSTNNLAPLCCGKFHLRHLRNCSTERQFQKKSCFFYFFFQGKIVIKLKNVNNYLAFNHNLFFFYATGNTCVD